MLIGGSKEGAKDKPSAFPVEFLFIFMQFLGKIGQNNSLVSPALGLASPTLPSTGKS